MYVLQLECFHGWIWWMRIAAHLSTYLFVRFATHSMVVAGDRSTLDVLYICPCVRIYIYIFHSHISIFFYIYFYYFQLTELLCIKPLSLCVQSRWRRYMCSWRRQKKIENSLFLFSIRWTAGDFFSFQML